MVTHSEATNLRGNWQAEVDSAAIYAALAEVETQPQLAAVYQRLAASETEHAAYWASRLRVAGAVVPLARPRWRARVLAALARRFGPQLVLPTLVQAEQAGGVGYAAEPGAQATEMPAHEFAHARLLATIAGVSNQGVAGGTLAQLEGRHRAAGGNALRAAVLGANDGLVSNLSLVMGVAGATLAGSAVLITGIAGLLAGAISMALGEWLSVQSARELYGRQLAIERQELEATPQDEAEELALIYQAKGLDGEQARAVAQRVIANGESALDTLAREELGFDPEELGGSAWVAALTSFLLFALGAVVPVVPFVFLVGTTAVLTSLLLSAIGLFAIGAGITLLTGRSVIGSGVRQVLFGLAAAGITYGIGRLIGVSIAG